MHPLPSASKGPGLRVYLTCAHPFLVDGPALVVIAGARVRQYRRLISGPSVIDIQAKSGVGSRMQLVVAAAAGDLPCLARGSVASLDIHGAGRLRSTSREAVGAEAA